MKKIKRKDRGFTLIELLVVIAIIAMLLSIIMPSLRKVKLHAFKLSGRSNLKQWGVMASMYAGDNDDTFQGGWGASSGGSNWWLQAWGAYYDNIGDIRCCPAATKLRFLEDGVTPGPGFDMTPQSTWGYNPWLGEAMYGSYTVNGWTESPTDEMLIAVGSISRKDDFWRKIIVSNASQIPLLMDGKWIDTWPDPDDPPWPREDFMGAGPTDNNNMQRIAFNRHDGVNNMVFLDLSVKGVPLNRFWELKWHRTFDTNGPYSRAGGGLDGTWYERVSPGNFQ